MGLGGVVDWGLPCEAGFLLLEGAALRAWCIWVPSGGCRKEVTVSEATLSVEKLQEKKQCACTSGKLDERMDLGRGSCLSLGMKEEDDLGGQVGNDANKNCSTQAGHGETCLYHQHSGGSL